MSQKVRFNLCENLNLNYKVSKIEFYWGALNSEPFYMVHRRFQNRFREIFQIFQTNYRILNVGCFTSMHPSSVELLSKNGFFCFNVFFLTFDLLSQREIEQIILSEKCSVFALRVNKHGHFIR